MFFCMQKLLISTQQLTVCTLIHTFTKLCATMQHTTLFNRQLSYTNFYCWLPKFFQNHEIVILNECSSTWSTVNNGLAKGLVLGPLLFSLYVNDISSFVDSPILLFDTKIYRSIKCRENYLQLQGDIANTWQLKLKCTLLHLGTQLHFIPMETTS